MDQNGIEALRQEMNRGFDAIAQEMNRRFDAVAEMFVQMGERMDARFDQVDRRFEQVDRRLERIETRLTASDFQAVGTQRWMDQLDHSSVQILATQAAQQKTIDELAARLKRVEERLGQ